MAADDRLYQAAQAEQAAKEGAAKNPDGSVNPDDIIIDGGDANNGNK